MPFLTHLAYYSDVLFPNQFSFFIYDLNQLATLKQMIAAFKPWEEEEIKIFKEQAKKVEVSLKGKMDAESLQECKYNVLAGEKGGYCACQVGNLNHIFIFFWSLILYP